MDFNAQNPHYFGRGKVHFTAPLRADGSVNLTAYGARWGDNWAVLPNPPGVLRMPPGRFVGNARGLVITPETTRLNTSAWDSRPNIIVNNVTAALSLYGHGAQNLADALHASRGQVASSTISEQFACSRAGVEAGSMIFVRHTVDVRQPVTVSPSWATWTEGVEFQREPFGVRMLQGWSGPVGATLAIAYVPEGSADSLEALQTPGLELGLVYTGINRADGAPVRMDCYRAQPQLDGGISPISEQAGAVNLKFVLKPVQPTPATAPRWYRVLRGNYSVQ